MIYAKFVDGLAAGQFNLLVDTIRALPIDLGQYSPDYNTDEFLNVVPSGARLGAAQTLGSKSFVNGVFDAADITFTGVTGVVGAALLYKASGGEGTSRLIALVTNVVGLPFTASGSQLLFEWDNGDNRIFRIIRGGA